MLRLVGRGRCRSGWSRCTRWKFSSNPSNWLGPVWIIVNYLVWAGVKRYGFEAEAQDLADKTLPPFAGGDDRCGNGSLQ